MTVESPELRVGFVRESSPATTKSSDFRELDDAFLQTQTRIWLGEVLQVRFDEETDISDLLADGELLYELSEVLSKMLPALSVDANQPKANEWKSLTSSKSTRRYMPYYNVGSFLKMCKNLGLHDIDLFTPSDVVDRRNTRKVCMCIRSLSKKTMSRDLNVPDFDNVTCTVAMPTDMVECIRKSLEMSQCSSSLSVEQEAEKVSRVRYWQRVSKSTSAVSNDNSDICDDAESSCMVRESYGHSDSAYDAESPNMSCSQVAGGYNSAVQLNLRDSEHEEEDQCEYLSPSNAESVGSPCSQYYSDQELSMLSPNWQGSHISGKVVELCGESKHEKGAVDHVPIDWEDSRLGSGRFRDVEANIGDDHVSQDKEEFNTSCSSGFSSNRNDKRDEHIEIWTHPSEIECEKSLGNTDKEVSCTDLISVGGRYIGGVCEPGFEDDYCTGESQIPRLEDASLSNNITEHKLIISNSNPDIGNGRVKHEDISKEPLVQRTSPFSSPRDISDFPSYDDENNVADLCTDVINVEGKPCCDTLDNANTISEDVASQLRFVDQNPCSLTSDECSCELTLAATLNGIDYYQRIPSRSVLQRGEPGKLLNGSETIVSADIVCPMTENDKEVFDANVAASDHTKGPLNKDLMGSDAIKSFDMPHMYLNPSPDVSVPDDHPKCFAENSQDTQSESEDLKVRDNGKPVSSAVNGFTTSLDDHQTGAEPPGNVEDTDHKHQQSAEDTEVKLEHANHEGNGKEQPLHKPHRKLLKSVVKGTALLGVAVFLLHLRKNRQENKSKVEKKPTELSKRTTLTHSSPKTQKGGTTSSVYPAEKLHLGL